MAIRGKVAFLSKINSLRIKPAQMRALNAKALLQRRQTAQRHEKAATTRDRGGRHRAVILSKSDFIGALPSSGGRLFRNELSDLVQPTRLCG